MRVPPELISHIRTYSNSVRGVLSNEDKYMLLIQYCKGFDQWQFYYDLMQFDRLLYQDGKLNNANLVDLKLLHSRQLGFAQLYVTYYNKGDRLKIIDRNIIPLHPYSDYTIVNNRINMIDIVTTPKEYKYQEFNEEIWKYSGMVSKDLDFIYGDLPRLDYLLDKWIKVHTDKQYAMNILGNHEYIIDKLKVQLPKKLIGQEELIKYITMISGKELKMEVEDPKFIRGIGYSLLGDGHQRTISMFKDPEYPYQQIYSSMI